MSTEVHSHEPNRPRYRFLALSLISFMGIAALAACVWFFIPAGVEATALFQVARSTPTILGEESILPTDNYETFKKSQLAYLGSEYVLTAALRDRGIAALSTFAGVADPVNWLNEHLRVEYPQDGEILAISLAGPRSQAEELVRIVDAVAKAFRDEVIYEQKQSSLASRDLLARSLENINKEIARDFKDFLDIARESGRVESGSGHVLQQLDLKRLDRIGTELMRLENAQNELQDGGDSGSLDVIERRIAQLRERQAELEKNLTNRAETSIELDARQRDLERLERIADEMSVKLEKLDIEANAPERIRQIQQAVLSDR
jgi:hypothetical protein